MEFEVFKPVKLGNDGILPPSVTAAKKVEKRRWSYIGPPEYAKLKLVGDLVLDLDNVNDEEIEMFLPTHPQLAQFFQRNV